MVFSPGTVTVTLLSPASATLAADLGLTSGQNVTNAVLHLPHADAEALVQAGVAVFTEPPEGQRQLGSAQVPVGTVATLLAGEGDAVTVEAPAAAILYLGGPGVTAATGFPLAAGQSLPLTQFAGAAVYGVLASGSGTAYVLRSAG